MKRFLFAIVIGLFLTSCSQSSKTNLPENSIFHLNSEWENQNGEFIELKELRGNVLVMVMIYTSCRTACPRLTADMQQISKKVGNAKKLKYVFVSIDPEVDTPTKMKEYLRMYKFDEKDWIFLRSTDANTRELANVLAVKYKEISPIDFSHSNIISVFDQEGNLVYQKEGLNIDIDATVSEIKKQIK